MAKVLAYTTTRAHTPQRRLALHTTLHDGRARAAHPFDWLLYDYSSDEATHTQLATDVHAGIIQDNLVTRNRGQHVAMNEALQVAYDQGYDYLLRVDDDIEWLSHRWLAKMLTSATTLGPQFIISPTVKGLLHPPDMSQLISVNNLPVRFLVQAIGGACRLHPVKLLVDAPTPYVSDIRSPLGGGDATGVMDWAKEMTAAQYPVYAVWLDHVRVRHSTARQVADDPLYHLNHGLYQKLPYLPPYPAEYPT